MIGGTILRWYVKIQEVPLFSTVFHPYRAKIISTVLALNTTKYLWNETEYMPWESTLDNLDFFSLMFDRSEVYGPMQVGLLPEK